MGWGEDEEAALEEEAAAVEEEATGVVDLVVLAFDFSATAKELAKYIIR